MKTNLIRDNRTGIIYKTTDKNVLSQTVGMLPPVFEKLHILTGNDSSKRIVDVFDIDLSYYDKKLYSYSRLPEFNWVNVLLEDNDLGAIARGMNPYRMLKSIYDKCVRTRKSCIVYVTRTGNISTKSLYGSTIEYRSSIIGVYRVCYMNGVENGIGALLMTNDEKVSNLLSLYKSKCRKE